MHAKLLHAMMKTSGYGFPKGIINLLITGLLQWAWLPANVSATDLGVDGSGRHLTVHGKPFFWLGDTVWLLTQLPSREELELYLRTRSEQGFTLIQLTAVMAEERVWGTLRASTRGDTPFVDGDVARPATTPGNDPSDPQQYDYWDHFDYVISRIHAYGLRPAVVTYFVGWQGEGYKYLKPENATGYGRFLADRFRGKPEIIWILGGDNTPNSDERKAVWNNLARGLAEGLTGSEDYSKLLMTYHINGGASSSQFWHSSPWLDFNMTQTWASYQDIYDAVSRDYQLTPAKPCGLGEGAYEDGPQYATKPINGLVIRKQACWSWFAAGYHTYGNGNVWHFDSLQAELTQPWKQALFSEGAVTLKHVRSFLEHVQWWKFIPDESLIVEGKGSGANLRVAMRHKTEKSIIAYVPGSAHVLLRTDFLDPGSRALWTNPASGSQLVLNIGNNPQSSFSLPQGWTDGLLLITSGDGGK